ncbi:MAG: hypothetical protein WBD79_17825, partial [Anaerolineae bacterium]
FHARHAAQFVKFVLFVARIGCLLVRVRTRIGAASPFAVESTPRQAPNARLFHTRDVEGAMIQIQDFVKAGLFQNEGGTIQTALRYLLRARADLRIRMAIYQGMHGSCPAGPGCAE